jgi:mannosyltransferase
MKRRFSAHLPEYGVLLLAAFLRFFSIAGQSLWSDEGNSVMLAGKPLAEIAARTAYDIHPPLYYWILHFWLQLCGRSEFALRSLSAVFSLLLVAVIFALARRLIGRRAALMAGFIAALSPFQVYYAQEGRMYALLSLLGALAVWSGMNFLRSAGQPRSRLDWGLLYFFSLLAGLYCQYLFPLMIVAVNLAFFILLFFKSESLPVSYREHKHKEAFTWLALNLAPCLGFLPWLPIALRQLLSWPSASIQNGELWAHLLEQLRLLSLGSTFHFGSELWLAPFVCLFLLGLWRAFKKAGLLSLCLLLWALLPLLLTTVLFKPAYLKFLLIAAPAYALLLALGFETLTANFRRQPALQSIHTLLWLAFFSFISLTSLNNYYFNPADARDDYRRMAAFLNAMTTPKDAVILNSEGQQEVFGYYYSGSAPVTPLPPSRPLNQPVVQAELEGIAAKSERIYVLYWASEESDPEHFIEGWLAENAYKAADNWYGNVRLASYGGWAAGMPKVQTLQAQVENILQLTGLTLSRNEIMPGQILNLELAGRVGGSGSPAASLFVQLLDINGHIVGQSDRAASAGSSWKANALLQQRIGLLVEPGTPPGLHRLIMGYYEPSTGKRLLFSNVRDYLEAGNIMVLPNEPLLPEKAFNLSEPVVFSGNGLTLLQARRYKLGLSGQPETPLAPGEPLHVELYWRLDKPIRDDISLEIVTAGQSHTFPLAGIDYPMSKWRPGEIVRGQYTLFLPADLSAGAQALSVRIIKKDRSAIAGPILLPDFIVSAVK